MMIFSVVILSSTATQMNLGLPAIRLTVAHGCLLLLMAESVTTYLRARSTWVGAIAAGPVILGASQALAVQPATVAIILAVLVNQSLYGSPNLARLRTLSAVSALPGSIVMDSLIFGVGDGDVSKIIVPAVLAAMLSLVLRTLYNALRLQLAAGQREALLANASRALLGVNELPHAHAILRDSAAALCAATSDLGLLIVRTHNGAAVVEHGFGRAERWTGMILPDTGLTAAEDRELAPLPRSTMQALDPRAGSRAELWSMPLGTCSDHLLLATSATALPQEIRDVLSTLISQLTLVEIGCRAHAELLKLAHHDSLTTIANRGAFFRELAEAVDAATRAPGRITLMIIDLDDFKLVNDTHGHAAGDLVLIEIARRMTEVAHEKGIGARFGGDEFALLAWIEEPADADRLAERLRDSLISPIPWQGTQLRVGASIGVVNGFPGAGAGDLMRCADIAMYSAKALGKNQVVRFSDEKHGSIAQTRCLEDHLAHGGRA